MGLLVLAETCKSSANIVYLSPFSILITAFNHSQTTSLMLLACALALAITGQMLSPFRTALGLASSTIACLSAVCVLVIICAEHAYSIHPSHLLGLFLAITALLDSAIAYSLFRHNVLVQGSLAAAVVAAKALLLCLEEISKRRLFINSELKEEAGKEATSGFWGKAFYVWLNATFWKGYKSTLTLDDLDQLNKNLKTQQLCDAFRDHWSKGMLFHINTNGMMALLIVNPFSGWQFTPSTSLVSVENNWPHASSHQCYCLPAVRCEQIRTAIHHSKGSGSNGGT